MSTTTLPPPKVEPEAETVTDDEWRAALERQAVTADEGVAEQAVRLVRHIKALRCFAPLAKNARRFQHRLYRGSTDRGGSRRVARPAASRRRSTSGRNSAPSPDGSEPPPPALPPVAVAPDGPRATGFQVALGQMGIAHEILGPTEFLALLDCGRRMIDPGMRGPRAVA